MDELRDAEIEKFHATACDEDICRLEIAVYYAAAVCGVERIRHLRSIAEYALDRKGSVNGRSFQVLHDQVWSCIVNTDVVERTDIGMVQSAKLRALLDRNVR